MGLGQRDRRGQVLLEYGIVLAGFVLVALVAVAVLGAKTSGEIQLVTTTAPGAHPGDNGPTDAGFLVPVREGPPGPPAAYDNGGPQWNKGGLAINFGQVAGDNDGTHSRLGEAMGATGNPFDGVINNVFETALLP